MLAQEAIEVMAKMAKEIGATQYDILAGENASSGLSVFQQKVQNLELSSNRGIGIRIFNLDKPGYAYTEAFTMEALHSTVRDAWSHTLLTGAVKVDLPSKLKVFDNAPTDLEQYNEKIEKLTMDEMKDFCLELEKLTIDADDLIKTVPYLGYSKTSSISYFLNHHGVATTHKRNSVQVGIGAVAQKGEISKLGVYSLGGRDTSDFDPKVFSKYAVERALELLEAEPVAHGKYKVLFNNRVSGQIMSMFQSPFFADNIQKGQSKLEGKIGQKIASSLLTISSDPWGIGLPGSELCDSEGVTTKPLKVVENGVLNCFLYNLETAQKDNVKSNAAASRGYSGKVGTAFSNYIIDCGKQSRQEILANEPKVLEIVKLEGGSGCSAISGEISIGAQGFLVENGVRVQAVDRITLSTNFFDLLNQIEAISNEYNDLFSSIKVPDILVNNISVAG